MYVKQTSTADVISHAPIRLENGRMVFHQCQPKLHFEKSAARYRQTVVDIENRLRFNLRIIKITRGT